jgi:hypothetical protein
MQDVRQSKQIKHSLSRNSQKAPLTFPIATKPKRKYRDQKQVETMNPTQHQRKISAWLDTYPNVEEVTPALGVDVCRQMKKRSF